ncbi:MAG: hypothetical protein AAGA63_14555 [Pseudomonadota bacterium]
MSFAKEVHNAGKVFRMFITRKLTKLLCAVACCAPVPALSQEKETASYPHVTGDIIIRLGYNGDYDSDPPLVEADDTFIDVIASPVFHFSERFRFITETRVETIMPPDTDRVFEDEGYFSRILLAEYSITDRLSVHAGKMTPSFALASFVTPGMYGNSYNREIELIERIGVGGAYVFGEGASGQHTLTFNTFFDDTTVFSESLGNNRGRNSRSDGGASNTEGLDSFTLSLEGRDMERFPGLTYKVGLIHQARGVDGVADEQGVSVALLKNYQTLGGVNWTLIGEVAALENFEGTADDIVYASAGLVYNKGPWTAILSGTYRPRFVADDEDFDDYTIQTSIEFDLGKGFSLALAHEFNRDENADNKRLGFRFSKVIQLGG